MSWAGVAVSENWMDVGREYTERWHHQMQIRDAVAAAPTLLEARWYRPLLELSVRATVDAAWRLLYNALPSPVPPTAITIDGDRRLAEPLLQTCSVVI